MAFTKKELEVYELNDPEFMQSLEHCLEAVSVNSVMVDKCQYPCDQIMDPQSGQLLGWLAIIRTCADNNDGIDLGFFETLAFNTLDPHLLLGHQYIDDWTQDAQTGDNRSMLDILVELSRELQRFRHVQAYPADKIPKFIEKVSRQVELSLTRTPMRTADADANLDEEIDWERGL